MITDRDNEIIKHFEEYRYATIEQLEKMFFKQQQYSYIIARRRLSKLKEAGFIKVLRDVATNKNIYIYKDNEDKVKIPSLHRIILLDVFSEMKYSGFNIELFEIEKPWIEGKIKSDGFAIFTINDRRYHFFIEIQLSNNPHNLKKYDELFETGIVQKFLGKEFYPRVLLISDRNYCVKLEHTQVLNLNLKLDSFSTILL